MAEGTVHKNVFESPVDIIDQHGVSKEDLENVTVGFKKLAQTFRDSFEEGEFEKFKESLERVSEAITDNPFEGALDE